MGRLFGTDGVQGIAIKELTVELCVQIGKSLAYVIGESTRPHPTIVIGKDTRASSDILEAAVCAGICAAGGDAICLGVVPTPAVAYLVQKRRAQAGVMISASYNSAEFNGLKIFGQDGYKISDETEALIEAFILDRPGKVLTYSGDEIGRMHHDENAVYDYVTHLESLVTKRFDGLRIAVDCANGCTCTTALELLSRLGARVERIYCDPDGMNINQDCGSTHIEHLMEYVRENRFDVGFAFDGDGDRCLAVDETGELVDGDKLMAIIAKVWKELGKLKKDSVVVTVMSNLGFTSFAKANGIRRVTSNIGDRYVLDKMLDGGYNLGGEQNGHIFFLDDATTGDGQLSAIRILEIMVRSNKKLSELAGIMKRFPQVMINVRIPAYQRENWKNDEVITNLIDLREAELGDEGRILVRESGTESLIRVMIEGREFTQINRIAMEISELIRQRLC
ncbi:MAG: phosphoglucosamine mutase [Oscillospiraceae bacterium]|nr:phosphoglucosamine mutase [Oscillospiraceae bacterium]